MYLLDYTGRQYIIISCLTYRASESNQRQVDNVKHQVYTHTAGVKSDKRCLTVICTVHNKGSRESVFVSGNHNLSENVHKGLTFCHGFGMIIRCEVSSMIKICLHPGLRVCNAFNNKLISVLCKLVLVRFY